MGGKILYVGAVMVDIICQTPELPQRGGSIVLWDKEMSLGGCAYNSARITRQLGGSCDLFAPLGRGPYASFAQTALQEAGFENLPTFDHQDCGACMCLIEPDGERSMITMPGIERCFESSWFEAVDTSSYNMVVVNGFELEGVGGEPLVSFLESNPSWQVIYAPGPRILAVDTTLTQRIEALHPLWHLNSDEALAFTGAADIEAAGQQLMAQGATAAVITAGGQGSYAFTPQRTVFAPSEAVVVVDTIGAGDSHLGAVLAGCQQGLDWAQSLERANRVSALVCSQAGATVESALLLTQ